MQKTVLRLGEIVTADISLGNNTIPGDLFKIVNLCGLASGRPASPSNYYNVVRVSHDGEAISTYRHTLYQRNIIPIGDKKLRLDMLGKRLKLLDKERSELEIEIDVISNFDTKDEYLAHKIKESIDTSKSDSVNVTRIKKILKTKVPYIVE